MSEKQRGKAAGRGRLGAFLGAVALVAGLLAGCRGDEAEGSAAPTSSASPPSAEALAAPDGVAVSEAPEGPDGGTDESGSTGEADKSQPAPRKIYYDLTHFDWYRRGEPLIHEERSYRPATVLPTGERELEREDEYQGVDFYVAKGRDEPADTLFVPVYTGYWLAFVPVEGAGVEGR